MGLIRALLGDRELRGQDKSINDPPPLAKPSQVAAMLGADPDYPRIWIVDDTPGEGWVRRSAPSAQTMDVLEKLQPGCYELRKVD